jgi:hypothetical protein
MPRHRQKFPAPKRIMNAGEMTRINQKSKTNEFLQSKKNEIQSQ